MPEYSAPMNTTTFRGGAEPDEAELGYVMVGGAPEAHGGWAVVACQVHGGDPDAPAKDAPDEVLEMVTGGRAASERAAARIEEAEAAFAAGHGSSVTIVPGLADALRHPRPDTLDAAALAAREVLTQAPRVTQMTGGRYRKESLREFEARHAKAQQGLAAL